MRLLLFCFFVAASLSIAFRPKDDDFIKQLLERLQAYNRQRPTEKVYVHTDRDVYLTGETIWLKGSLFNGNTHDADTSSKVLYVDLVDLAAKRTRLRMQLRTTNSYAPGQLSLPDTLPSGTYQLRAYTNYMKNFPDTYFFTKTLTILRPDETSDKGKRSATTSNAKLDVQFLPEGGQLVAGLEGRVAFKAIDGNGQGVSVRGFVLNSQKDTVSGFSSRYLGMGFFTFKPEPAQTYTAFIQTNKGQFVSYAMPTAQAQGITMQVDNLSNKENVIVYVIHNKSAADAGATLTLVAQTRGQVVSAAKIPIAKKMSALRLPKKEFPEGIAQITIFDETNKPAAERLVFINNNEQLRVQIAPTKTVYKNREQVNLDISTTDADGKPVSTNLSLAAVDTRLSPETDSNGTTIVSHLLLSSDLTGNIEQPDYYFNPTHTDRWIQLDLLLMTQGWRRFAWSNVLTGNVPPVKYPVEEGLSLTGRVVRPNQKDVGGKVALTFVLSRRDSTRSFLMGETDEAGNYGAYGLDFSDTTTVFIQGVKGSNNRNLVISLDQLVAPPLTLLRVPFNPLEVSRDEYGEFIRRAKEYQEIERQIRQNREVLLQAVTVKAKKQEPTDSRKIYGRADATVKFDAMNTAGRLTILDVIQGRVAGVQVTGTGMSARVQIRGAANFSGPVEPLFVIDGMPTDLQGAMSISVQDVDQVDILKGASAAIYGSRASGGVISILTKRGDSSYDYSKDLAPGTLVAKLPGFTAVREFYAPQYNVTKPEHVRPDYRTTLFWSPLIQTNAEGKANVSFFTSDSKTTIRLQAEGATLNGMPGVGRSTLRVD
ncbi:TonB-dependent receptor plug domain-containing protein [Spirosoma sp. BT702]|uniref:TonB-dependent receptor plug domain-containing protein n=1 Tax=Spirosoma profusum TaxID=2771354 RepID=A0A926Y3E2_9BACT|nr:TonB-dependent receptor plug domain-containing protein [Spirosoma profusum]MBD2701795.1 TonB-dependent receptor plug domain-containing protein [Spirosoma profusum]